jgi:autophagy-related protein 16
MNEANDFYENMRSRHQAVINWRGEDGPPESGSGAVSGNGVRSGEGTQATMPDVQRSQPETGLDRSPNG